MEECMRVFVTGASGHVGSAVVPELLKAGHRVVALARTDAAAVALEKTGSEVWRGDLGDAEGLARAASEADGVIHLAYRHDLAFSGSPDGFAEAARVDLEVTRVLGRALAGTGKPLVTTAGTAMFALHGESRWVTEDVVLPQGHRVDAENLTVGFASQGVRSAVIRLAPTVHSTLDHNGFVPMLIALARKNGFAAFVGNGENVWNAVHTLDAARLYRMVLEGTPAGSRWHAVAEEAVTFRTIAQTIGDRLGVPTKSLKPEEAPAYFGGFSAFAQLHCPASSDRTREALGWEPVQLTLVEDLKGDHYFRER